MYKKATRRKEEVLEETAINKFLVSFQISPDSSTQVQSQKLLCGWMSDSLPLLNPQLQT